MSLYASNSCACVAIYEAGRAYEASLVLDRMTCEGGEVPYQIADAIPCNRTFAYSIGEVVYEDRMAEHLFGRLRGAPRRFVLSDVEELYLSPYPYTYSKARVALQKTALSLMRLYEIAVLPHYWATFRHREEDDGRVFKSASFEQGITTRDFPELPEAVRGSLLSLGVHAPLPYALKHSSFACSDLAHSAHADLVYNVERKWAWALGNAFMTQVHVKRCAFVQPVGVPSFLGRVASDLPVVLLHLLEANSKHATWSRRLCAIPHAPCLSSTRANAAPIDRLHHARAKRFSAVRYAIRRIRGKAVLPPPSAAPTGRGAGVGSVCQEAQRKRHREVHSDFPTFAPSCLPKFWSPDTSNVSPQFASGVLPVPPLSLARQDPLPPSATPQLVLSEGDILAIPELARAYGPRTSSRTLRRTTCRLRNFMGNLRTLCSWRRKPKLRNFVTKTLCAT